MNKTLSGKPGAIQKLKGMGTHLAHQNPYLRRDLSGSRHGCGAGDATCQHRGYAKHLEEISASIATNAYGVVIMDGAGWHKSGALNIPQNLSTRFRGKPSTGRFSFPSNLPPYSPELIPTENIWQYLRQTYLSNRVFETWENIVDACRDAWNRLTAETGRIKSIATQIRAVAGQ